MNFEWNSHRVKDATLPIDTMERVKLDHSKGGIKHQKEPCKGWIHFYCTVRSFQKSKKYSAWLLFGAVGEGWGALLIIKTISEFRTLTLKREKKEFQKVAIADGIY